MDEKEQAHIPDAKAGQGGTPDAGASVNAGVSVDAGAADASSDPSAGHSKPGKPKRKPSAKPVRYIKQPYSLSAIQADLSKQQIKILVGMMQSIQDGVQEMFERQNRTNGQLLLFPELEDDHVNIDFKFSDVVDRPDYYENVEKVAQKFVEMVFRYEDKEQGEVTLSHFVDEVTYPSRGSKRDKIRFSFTKKQAEKVFNFTMYSKYMLSVAFQADSKYTARLYMLITSARGYSTAEGGTFHWYVSYQELRRMLGCDVKEGGQWVPRSRRLYKHFKADILRVAEKELKELADHGNCDCWFEFVELPTDWKGQPKTLDFVVHLSEMGLLEAQRTSEAATFRQLRQLMQDEWKLTERDCSAFLGKVPEWRVAQFEARVHELADTMRLRADEIKDVRRYAKKSLSEIVKEMEEPIPPTFNDAQGDLFAAPTDDASASASQASAGQPLPTAEEVVDRWFRVLDQKDYQMYIRGLERSMTIDSEGIHLQVAHEEVRKQLEGWRDCLEAAAGLPLDVIVIGSPRPS